MYKELIVVLLAMAPIFELRASIPFGLTQGLNFYLVLLLSLLANILGAIIAFYFVKYVIPILRKIGFVDKIYKKYIVRTRRKAEQKIDKYGGIGLALFIGMPLPGSGVWTGALAAQLLNINFRKFFKASIVGILLAATLVTVLTQAGIIAWQYG